MSSTPVASASIAGEATSPSVAALELSDDDLEHVVGGLERIYVYDPQAAESGF